MNLTRSIVAGIICLSLTSCATWQPKTTFGRNVQAWWQAPATQEGVAFVTKTATQFVINSALAALQQYASGSKKIDYKEIAVQGGIATLYTQAGSIRTLQGTSQVIDPVAIAQVLEQGGTPDEISRNLAGSLFDSATAMIRAGLSPDEAAEVNAAALDQAALQVSTAVNEK